MTVKYEYKSMCCGHEYTEQRAANESMFFSVCLACGKADYELVKETILSETIEVSPAETIITE